MIKNKKFLIGVIIFFVVGLFIVFAPYWFSKRKHGYVSFGNTDNGEDRAKIICDNGDEYTDEEIRGMGFLFYYKRYEKGGYEESYNKYDLNKLCNPDIENIDNIKKDNFKIVEIEDE